MTAAPPVIVAPASLSLASYAVSGVSVADPFAASNPGLMTLNLSAQFGAVAVSGSAPAQHVTISATLIGVNAALATLSYTPPVPAVADAITVNAWNQQGSQTTISIGVAAPTSVPAPSPPPTGTQASRIADLLSMTGANMFPSLVADQNVWGSYPADYTPATVIAAMEWLTNGSGVMPLGRVYFFAADLALLSTWLPQLAATGMRFSVAIGANGGMADVPALLQLAANPANAVAMIEGLNEPNNDFGSGVIPVAATIAVQAALWAGKPAGVKVAGPSIVFGLPYPEGYIAEYATAAELAALTATMDVANGHFYPPALCDLDDGSGRGGAFADVVDGLGQCYPGKPLALTEFEPTLYLAGAPGGNATLDAYYLPLFLLSAFDKGIRTAVWFPLFDFGTAYTCGLFPGNAANPRPAAWAIRKLHTLAGDPGATARTFTPGRLAYTVSGGAPPISAASPGTGLQTSLFQASDGRFFLFLCNAQVAPVGTTQTVTVTFARPPSSVSEYSIDGSPVAPVALATRATPGAWVTGMDACVRLLVIQP